MTVFAQAAMWGLIYRLAILSAFLLLAATLLAQGGPPLRTDDPATPGNGNFEVNLGVTTERRSGERVFEAPVVDINYGLGDRIQLKFELPWVVRGTDAGPTRSGLGNSLLGVKWRFFERKAQNLAISTYPQLEFNNPTRSVDRGLVERGPHFLLPLEVAKKVGPVDLNGEAGYWFSRTDQQRWLAGLAVGRHLNDRLELLSEVYSIGQPHGRDTTFDFGGRLRLYHPMLLIFMAGRSFRGPDSGEPQLIGYLGLQLQFSTHKSAPQRNPPLIQTCACPDTLVCAGCSSSRE